MAALGNITYYADDPSALSHFWADVFGYPHTDWEEPLRSQLLGAGLTEADLATRAVAEDPTGKGPRLFFHHADRAKSGRSRIHLDVSVAHDGEGSHRERLEAEKVRLVALGATMVRLIDQQWGPWPDVYYQMRDPEGNEFCLQ
ncbi:VOC family protein [Microbacterium kribbense]|uniref:VOC family protein n=1 Tax=Microbacterium kribbense TaxID=433645 RepID=A0ABP7GAY4_9MICO